MVPKVENKDFDGEMVVVMDQCFALNRHFPAIVTSRRSDRTQVLKSFMIARPFSHKLSIKDSIREGDTAETVERFIRLRKLYERQLAARTNSELMEIILQGRMQVAFLLNSCGGDGEVLHLYKDMIDEIADRRGESHSYVTRVAGSAAFDIMAVSDQAYALDTSRLAWHLTMDCETDEVVEDCADDDKSSLLEFLRKGDGPARDAMLVRANAALDDEYNLDSYVSFIGEQAARAKCIDGSFEDVGQMRKFFGSQFWSASHPLIRKFWQDSTKQIEDDGGI